MQWRPRSFPPLRRSDGESLPIHRHAAFACSCVERRNPLKSFQNAFVGEKHFLAGRIGDVVNRCADELIQALPATIQDAISIVESLGSANAGDDLLVGLAFDDPDLDGLLYCLIFGP